MKNHSETQWFRILTVSVASLRIPATALFITEMLWVLRVNDFIIIRLSEISFPMSALLGIVGFWIQYPIYAMVLLLSNSKGRVKAGIIIVLSAHILGLVWALTHFRFQISP